MTKINIETKTSSEPGYCAVRISTTEGWDGSLWVVIAYRGGSPLDERVAGRIATWVRDLTCWPPEQIKWFSFHPEEGFLDSEVESLNIDWNSQEGRYASVSPLRARSDETTWLRVNGCLPAAGDSSMTPEPLRAG